MNRLQNKVAVVIGGNSGIGLASAQEFAKEGAKVAITGRNAQTLATAVKEIGHGAISVQADIIHTSAIEPSYKEISTKLGKFDVLFVNAGIFKGLPIDQMTEELYDEIMDINVKGVYFSVQKALPYLNDGASVILNASAVDVKGLPNASAYSASKAAVRSLARGFSTDLLARHIRVNVISPGAVETPIISRLGMPQEMADAAVAGLISVTPLKRLGTSIEIAHAVVFLASDESTFMLGSEITPDGGFSQL